MADVAFDLDERPEDRDVLELKRPALDARKLARRELAREPLHTIVFTAIWVEVADFRSEMKSNLS